MSKLRKAFDPKFTKKRLFHSNSTKVLTGLIVSLLITPSNA